MDEQQLENLAREYAEEATKPQKSDPDMSCSDLNEMKRDVVEYAKEIIHWLSKRFYFADKEQAGNMYREAVEGKCQLEKMRPQNIYIKNAIAMRTGMNMGSFLTLEVLFPEIAKETKV